MGRSTYRDIPRHLSNLEAFTGHSMHAVVAPDHPRYGRLCDEEQVRLRLDEGVGLRYLVYSYGTPIAWVRTDGRVYVVQQRFSVTTSRQQNLCHAWL